VRIFKFKKFGFLRLPQGGYPSGLTLRRRGTGFQTKGGVSSAGERRHKAHKPAQKGFDVQGLAVTPAVRVSPLRWVAQPGCGVRRIMTQFLPQGGYGFPLAGDVVALSIKNRTSRKRGKGRLNLWCFKA